MINIDKLTVSYHDRVVKWQWRLAPAYDLTLCAAGYNGEHATSVNNLGNPTYEDMVTVRVRTKMKEKRCLEIIQEVRSNVGDLLSKNFNINKITKQQPILYQEIVSQIKKVVDEDISANL